jgi:adenosylhomocysteine nucleosidase
MPVARGSGIAMWQLEINGKEVVAVCAGMGAAAARRAFTAAEFAGSLDVAVSVGWAGALSADSRPGECYVVSQVVDALTGERFATGSAHSTRLVTTGHVADQAEKHRLRDTYGASLVDMEAATVARLSQMRGITVHCLKAVSDGVEANLPDLNPFIDIDGKMKMPSFLGYVAVRPRYWVELARLGRNSAAGAVAMAHAVNKFLAEGAF